MHSTLVRIQNVFGFFTTVAFFVAGLVALSSLLYPANVSVDVIKANGVKMYCVSLFSSFPPLGWKLCGWALMW